MAGWSRNDRFEKLGPQPRGLVPKLREKDAIDRRTNRNIR